MAVVCSLKQHLNKEEVDMEELFEQLKGKIQEGNDFFDLIAKLVKEMDDAGFKDSRGQLEHIRLNVAAAVEVQLLEALMRAGYPSDEAETKTMDFITMLSNFPRLTLPPKDLEF